MVLKFAIESSDLVYLEEATRARSGMALEMKASCEKCGRALDIGDEAHICSYECTFCAGCSAQMKQVCPNCGGELLRRPKRQAPRASA
jgi:uncharacterized protein